MVEWYDLIPDGGLQQGDFFRHLNIYVQDSPDIATGTGNGEETEREADIEEMALSVIMSQSCDLDGSHEYAILCPVYTVDFLIREWGSEARVRDAWNDARAGRHLDLFPLPRCDRQGWERVEALVDFKRVFEVKASRLEEFRTSQTPWLRLVPPYRELMAQHFARKIMRIALTDDVRVPPWSAIAATLPNTTSTATASGTH